MINGIVIWLGFWKKLGMFVLTGAVFLVVPNLIYQVVKFHWWPVALPNLAFVLGSIIAWAIVVIASIRWYYLHLPQILYEREGQTPWPVHDPSMEEKKPAAEDGMTAF